jgi:hypothetical protein
MQREVFGRQCLSPRTAAGAVAVLSFAWLAFGCAPTPLAGVLVTLTTDGKAQRPDHVMFSWADDKAVLLRDVRVPERGVLPASGDPLVSVFVEGDARAVAGRRVAIARGLVGRTVVSSGAIGFRRLPGTRQNVTLALKAGEPRDRDGDGVPDEVDTCPDVGTGQALLSRRCAAGRRSRTRRCPARRWRARRRWGRRCCAGRRHPGQ